MSGEISKIAMKIRKALPNIWIIILYVLEQNLKREVLNLLPYCPRTEKNGA